jgi:hypothetical protein
MYVQCICIHAMVRTMYVQCMNMVHAYYKYHPPECLHHGGIRESLKLHAQSKYMYCMYNVCTLYIHMTYTVWVCTSPFTYKAHTVVCHNDMQEFGVVVSWHLKANLNAIVWTRNRGCQLSMWKSRYFHLYMTCTCTYSWHPMYLYVHVRYGAFLTWKADTLDFWSIL